MILAGERSDVGIDRPHLYRLRHPSTEEGAECSPADQALIYASLAQAEATLEVLDLLRNGIVLRQAEELSNALNHLANRLPDR